jgi:hypothetical protein
MDQKVLGNLINMTTDKPGLVREVGMIGRGFADRCVRVALRSGPRLAWRAF